MMGRPAAAARQRDRAAAKASGPAGGGRARKAGGGGGAEIELAVRIRPGAPNPAVGVAEGGAVHVGGESFTYQSSVVCGSDQVVAFDALASRLVSRAQEGYSCTLMAYGQTGSGKTHTMFGPPGCLTEASVAASGGSVPADWGLFPRTVLTLMNAPGIEPTSVHASAVEVYHELVFDLLDDRSQLQVGTSNLKPMGYKVGGEADIGLAGARGVGSLAVNGVHPASCTCRKCFKAQEDAKEAAKAARQAKIAAAKSGGGARGGARAGARGAGAGPNPDTFATVGEKLINLRGPEDVARFARYENAFFCAVLYSKRSVCQDRLGRSIGKALRKQMLCFLTGRSRGHGRQRATP